MLPLDYLSFDLLLEAQADGYRARVIASPAGEAKQDFDLATFAAITISGATDAQAIGAALFTAVFAGDVGDCLARAWQTAQIAEKGLRLRLRIDPQASALANLPWETLFWVQQQRFLALSVYTPIVRYIERPRVDPPLSVSTPLRLLVLTSVPADLTTLDSEHEWRLLQEATAALVEQGQLVIERLAPPTLPRLQDRLRQGDIHLLHFMGHGLFDEQTQQGSLFFEDEAGNAHEVAATTLATLLHDQPPRLIFLNACQGATSDQQNFFAGVAQTLVQQRIPAVIAMQALISDAAAITLAHTFYKALAADYPVDAALAEARKALYVADPTGTLTEWATPILFSRAPDNRLFDARTVANAPSEVRPAQIDTGGGTSIGGDATVAGDLVGHDQIIYGDKVHGDKIAGDKIVGDKITNIYITVPKRPVEPTSPLLGAEIIRQSFEPETVLIPAGPFWMGSDEGAEHERPRHQVTLPTYRMGKYPLMNSEYLAFVRDQGIAVAPETRWELAAVGQEPPPDKQDHPVVGISWDDALRYCAWLTEKTRRAYRLPSEAEWEKAARGEQGSRYPWGDDFDPARCNSAAAGVRTTTDVHAYAPQCESSYGCADMVGNVWEWTNTIWGVERNAARFKYPYTPNDGREKLEKLMPFRELRICRGGSYQEKAERLPCATRTRQPADGRDARRGLRVLMEV